MAPAWFKVKLDDVGPFFTFYVLLEFPFCYYIILMLFLHCYLLCFYELFFSFLGIWGAIPLF